MTTDDLNHNRHVLDPIRNSPGSRVHKTTVVLRTAKLQDEGAPLYPRSVGSSGNPDTGNPGDFQIKVRL